MILQPRQSRKYRKEAKEAHEDGSKRRPFSEKRRRNPEKHNGVGGKEIKKLRGQEHEKRAVRGGDIVVISAIE